MELVRELAVRWLSTADRVGWGIEGPEHAHAVRSSIQQLARIESPDETIESSDGRPLGTRPVDALSEAAELLGEAARATGARRDELLSAARGWLIIAES